MSMESDLVALLRLRCPRVHPEAAPALNAPWITYQHIGGVPLRYFDNDPMSLRHSMVQIDVYAASKAEALTLIHQIEDDLCATTNFCAEPMSEHTSDYDADMALYHASQDFDVWANR